MTQLLDLFQPLLTVQSEPHQVLVENLACQIRVQTRDSHAFRDNGAGDDLSAVKRSERWNSLLDVNLCAVHLVMKWLNNNVHVIKLPR